MERQRNGTSGRSVYVRGVAEGDGQMRAHNCSPTASGCGTRAYLGFAASGPTPGFNMRHLWRQDSARFVKKYSKLHTGLPAHSYQLFFLRSVIED